MIVSEINEILKINTIEAWNIDNDPAEYAINKKTIRVEDRLLFDRIIDLCRCFGKNYKGMQKSYFSVGNEYYIWCPKLAVMVDGKRRQSQMVG